MNHPIAERLVPDARSKLRNQFHEKLPKKVSVNQVVIFLPGLLLFSLHTSQCY